MRRRRSKWQRMQTFIYNAEEKKFCSRTPLNWFAVFSFFCSSLIIIFAIAILAIYALTYMVWNIDSMHKNKENILDDHYPAISIVPEFGSEDSPLIWFKKNNITSGYKTADFYERSIKTYLKPYEDAEKNTNKYSDCTEKKGEKPCMFKPSDLGECKETTYNNENNDLCVFVKLGNVPNWKPRTMTDLDDLPTYTPDFIRSKLKEGSNAEKNQIWLYCTGSTEADSDHLKNIEYYPQQGFAWYYYPYDNHKDYLRPIVAVRISSLKTGVIISISCAIYNANLSYEYYGAHSYTFALYIEE